MANIVYDPKIIQQFANQLYSRANGIIALCTLMGLGGEALAGNFLGYYSPKLGDMDTRLVGTVIGACLGALIGYLVGSARAFLLKLQAQTALCQRQIEENTRPLIGKPVAEARP
jgi:hypothetical protein